MFWGAARYTVFDDEAFSCQRYVLPLGDMVSALWHGQEPDPPLYYILINGWTRLFGVGPVGLRSLSIVIFLLGLLVIRRAGAACFGRRAGNLALALCALHPAHLFFGFAARWYSLMFLTTALLLWATARLARCGTGAPGTGMCGTGVSPVQSCGTGVSPVCDANSCGTGVSPVQSCASRAARAGNEEPPHSNPHPSPLASSRLSRILAWSLAAAAVCYTNYFGIVVVALIWLVGLLRGRTRRRPLWPWLAAGVIALALYSPWLVPLYHQAALFPAPNASLRSVAAAAARTLMALTTGNLASLAAWWVWLPMGLFCLSLAVLLVRRWRRVWPLAVVVLGCFAVGVATRTMIDKYVMTFSGPACLLVAALLTRRQIRLMPPPIHNPKPALDVRQRRVAHQGSAIRNPRSSFILHPSSFLLLLAWLACGFNLVTEKHWSSLRWLDPFEQALTDILARPNAAVPRRYVVLVVSHPTARYYAAARSADTEGPRVRTLNTWQALIGPTTDRAIWDRELSRQDWFGELLTWLRVEIPSSFLPRSPVGRRPDLVATLETAGFADLPEWDEVHRILQRDYVLVDERHYLEDPDAAWKDRLDPAVKHPPWRITVRWWKSLESAELKIEHDEK